MTAITIQNYQYRRAAVHLPGGARTEHRRGSAYGQPH
jgi:hypothetical protein